MIPETKVRAEVEAADEAPAQLEAVRAPTDDSAPHWVRDSVVYQRVAEYVRVTWRMLRAPGDFAETWADGKERLPNPLHFWLAVIAVQTTVYNGGLQILLGPPMQQTFLGQVMRAIAQYGYLPTLGLFAHWFCKLGGGRRTARVTVGTLLFAASGPSAVFTLSTLGVLLVAHAFGASLHLVPVLNEHAGQNTVSIIGYTKIPLALLIAPMLSICIYLSLMLRRIQRVRFIWPLLGFLLGVLAPGLLGALAGFVAKHLL